MTRRPFSGKVLALFLGVVTAASTASLAIAQEPPARRTSVGHLELVAKLVGDQPAGIAVSRRGRIFVTFPRHDGDVAFTVAELSDGVPVAYPSRGFNRASPEHPADALFSVQSLVVDGSDHLWMLDTGTLKFGEPPVPGAPKLVEVDLTNGAVLRVLPIPAAALIANSALKDFRLDFRGGSGGVAYITDSAPSHEALIVFDLATRHAMRRLSGNPAVGVAASRPVIVGDEPLVEWPAKPGATGSPRPWRVGLNAVELSADGGTLFLSAFTTGRLYSVATRSLSDAGAPDAEPAGRLQDIGPVGIAGHFVIDGDDRLYFMDMEHDAIYRRAPDGRVQLVVADPRLMWPDTMAIGSDEYLYVTTSQNDRRPEFHDGDDLRRRPYGIFRTFIGAEPVYPARP